MILLVAYFIYLIIQSERALTRQLIGLLIMYGFIALFFSSTFQVSSSMILFIKRYISQDALGFYIPANAFASFISFFCNCGVTDSGCVF